MKLVSGQWLFDQTVPIINTLIHRMDFSNVQFNSSDDIWVSNLISGVCNNLYIVLVQKYKAYEIKVSLFYPALLFVRILNVTNCSASWVTTHVL